MAIWTITQDGVTKGTAVGKQQLNSGVVIDAVILGTKEDGGQLGIVPVQGPLRQSAEGIRIERASIGSTRNNKPKLHTCGDCDLIVLRPTCGARARFLIASPAEEFARWEGYPSDLAIMSGVSQQGDIHAIMRADTIEAVHLRGHGTARKATGGWRWEPEQAAAE